MPSVIQVLIRLRGAATQSLEFDFFWDATIELTETSFSSSGSVKPWMDETFAIAG